MYEADGFFPTEEAAKAWMDKYSQQKGYPFGSNKFHAGDLIYKDTNGDGTPDTPTPFMKLGGRKTYKNHW